MYPLTHDERRQVYRRLVRGAEDPGSVADPLADRWNFLMAAHVVGQYDPALHLDSHRRMLHLARASGDWHEAAGQALRITLLPLGHLLQRLPEGNVGRATVGITEAMVPPEPVQLLIDWAVLGTRIAGTRR
ncbi:MAG: DUF3703 domain-containing protein [Ramlibacter sp.]